MTYDHIYRSIMCATLVLISTAWLPFHYAGAQEQKASENPCKNLSSELDKRGNEQVPVYDESNHLMNTVAASALESLWQKECVIDTRIRNQADTMKQQMREAAFEWLKEGHTFRSAQDIESGEGGVKEPPFARDVTSHLLRVDERTFELFRSAYEEQIEDENFFAQDVINAITKERTREVEYTLTDEEAESLLKEGKLGESGWKSFGKLISNPRNSPVGEYFYTREQLRQRQTEARQEEERQLQYGRGYFPKRDTEGNIVIPGAQNQRKADELITQEYTDINAADEIGELIERKYWPISDIVTDTTDPDKGLEDADVDDGWELVAEESHRIPLPDEPEGTGLFDDGGFFGGGPFDFGGFDNFGELLEGFDFNLEAILDQFDPRDLLNWAGLDELSTFLDPQEILDLIGVENLVDLSDPSRLLETIGLDRLINEAGGINELLKLFDQEGILPELINGNLDALINEAGGIEELLDDLLSGNLDLNNPGDAISLILDQAGIPPEARDSVDEILEHLNQQGYDVPNSPEDLNPQTRENLEDYAAAGGPAGSSEGEGEPENPAIP